MPLGTPTNGQVVYDPRGVVEISPIPLGRRVQHLDGLRLGILSNRKWNGNTLLRKARAVLEQDYKFAAVKSFSKNADPGLLGEIIAKNDIVLTAIGD
jgi:hypothetical protein